MNTAQAAQSV